MPTFKSPLAERIASEVEKVRSGSLPKERVRALNEWFENFRSKFSPEESLEIQYALGRKVDAVDRPFLELVPEGWFRDLLTLMDEAESPRPFYFLAGLTVMAQAIGRNVTIDRGTHQLGLDISALLISPAGKGRRSTACDFVVYEIGEPAGLNIIADSFSYEAFGDALVESAGFLKVPPDRQIPRPHALIYAGEMSVLLGKGSYVDSIIPKLTDIIGKMSRFEWRTVKRGGKLVFRKPCVNALFTSAPDWMVDNLPPVVFGGGMLSRFLICFMDQMEKAVTWGKPLDAEKKEKLIAGLRRISRTVRGAVPRPEGEAFKWYDEWYQEHCRRYLNGDIPDVRMEPYFSRKHDHLLRVAMLLEIAAGGELRLRRERLEQALDILDWLESGVPRAYAQMALSPIAAAQRAVCEVLRRNGGTMAHSTLQKKLYRHLPLKEQFKAVMESLIEMGVITPLPTLGSKRGRSYMLRRTLD